MRYTLENDVLKLMADTHGAEIVSVLRDGAEYIWNGEPAFRGCRTQVLFPFAGQVRGGVYRHHGVQYRMGQHGFARDQEFELLSRTENSLTFLLYFSIGGHPAFFCPLHPSETWADYEIELRKDGVPLDRMVIRPIEEGGKRISTRSGQR